MTILHLEHSKIDKYKWDNCIRNSGNQIVYAYSWFLDIVSPKWEALVKGDYELVFPLCTRNKIGIKYLFQPCFNQQLGFFSTKSVSQYDEIQIFDYIFNNFSYVEININNLNNCIENKFSKTVRISQTLNLNLEHEKLYSNYSGRLKTCIRKAMRTGVRIEKNISVDKVIQVFHESKVKKVKPIYQKHLPQMKKIIDVSMRMGFGNLWGAYDTNQKIISSAFFIKTNDRIYFLFNATNDDGRKHCANHLLINEIIKEHSNDLTVLDFVGSSVESIKKFNQGFGTENNSYYQIKKNNLPIIIRWVKK